MKFKLEQSNTVIVTLSDGTRMRLQEERGFLSIMLLPTQNRRHGPLMVIPQVSNVIRVGMAEL